MSQRLQKQPQLESWACLDASTLKIIAMVIMLIDHIGAVLFPFSQYPQMLWMRVVGRISFPIFAYFVAEGYLKCKSRLKYILRMFIFAVCSEIPFDLAISGRIFSSGCNIGFTFLIVLIGMFLSDEVKCRLSVRLSYWAGELAGCIIIIASAILAELLDTDYGWYGVMLVYIYRVLHDQFLKKHIIAAAFQIVAATWIQRFSALSTLLLMLYNGEKGRNLKYLFYIFYPAHLLVLALIANIYVTQ
jgi:hypothetical protein